MYLLILLMSVAISLMGLRWRVRSYVVVEEEVASTMLDFVSSIVPFVMHFLTYLIYTITNCNKMTNSNMMKEYQNE
jgi:hypothetical protein